MSNSTSELNAKIANIEAEIRALEASLEQLEEERQQAGMQGLVGQYFQLDPDDLSTEMVFLHVQRVNGREAVVIEVSLEGQDFATLRRSSWGADAFEDPNDWPYAKPSTMEKFDAAFTEALARITSRQPS